MSDPQERLGKVEQRLESMEGQIVELRKEVGGLRTESGTLAGRVDTLTGRVDTLTGRVDTLTAEVQKLRVLTEDDARQITLIAEVQVHHGTMLEHVVKELEPLKVLPGLLQHVVQDHERRITALEQRPGTS